MLLHPLNIFFGFSKPLSVDSLWKILHRISGDKVGWRSQVTLRISLLKTGINSVTFMGTPLIPCMYPDADLLGISTDFPWPGAEDSGSLSSTTPFLRQSTSMGIQLRK